MQYIRHAVHQYIQSSSTLYDIYLGLIRRPMLPEEACKLMWVRDILTSDFHKRAYQSKVDELIPNHYSDEPYRELLSYLRKWGWRIFKRSLLQIFKNKLNHLLTVEVYNNSTQTTVRNYLTKIKDGLPADISTKEYLDIIAKQDEK